ncbi:hypothetical protein AB0J72_24710 [Dactylosporangium sp. NPDC049742]|uniref:hypothetical protein n=1 Tax=Dactylosporangium sp. NPDC049742 TaxID=3154737 RepID=UPI00343CCE90
MTQPPGPDESTGPAQPSEPVPPVDSGQPRTVPLPGESGPEAEGVAPPVPGAAAGEAGSDGAASVDGSEVGAGDGARIRPPVPAAQEHGAGAYGQPGHPGQPQHPGQLGYPGQPPYPGQPGQPGQPQYPGQPGHPGQSPYQGQPGYQGQPPYPGQPYYPGQAGYPGQGQFGYPGQAGAYGAPQYPAGAYDQSQGYGGVYDPSQAYAIYQMVPVAGVIGEGDPLVSPDFAGWWRRSMAILRRGWDKLALLQLIGLAVVLAYSVPLSLVSLDLSGDLSRTDPVTGAPVPPDPGQVFPALGLILLGSFVGVFVSFVVSIASNHVAVAIAAGVRPRLGAALLLAARRVFPLLGWQVLAGLIVCVGFCACFLPAIYLAAVFTLLPAVVTFERGGSAISRCFKLFHQDLGASISRIATTIALGAAAAFVGAIISIIVQGGTGGASALSLEPVGVTGADGKFVLGVVLASVVSEVIARAGAVVTAPMSLATYADMRARVEGLSTATLASEIGLAPDAGQYNGQQPEQPPVPVQGQQPEQGSDQDWMPPNR